MMVADVCLSLSRKKEDKVLGTGRVHVMKNRYGNDGMTFEAKIDTDNGHIEIQGAMTEAGKPQNQFADIAKKFFSAEPSPF